MSEGEGTMVDKSESSSFEDLASAAIAEEIEEAKLAEAAAAEKDKSKGDGDSHEPEWKDLLGSGALLKKVRTHYLLYVLYSKTLEDFANIVVLFWKVFV